MVGRIPQEFLEQLLSRVDITEVIDTRVPLRKAGRDYVARCPFHNEKTPSFTVSASKQFYYCFGCHATGNAISFLMEYDGLEFLDAVEELAHSTGLEIPRNVNLTDLSNHGALHTLMAQADGFFQRQLREHPNRSKVVAYLRGRGLDGKITKRFGMGYAPAGWDNLYKALTAKGHQQADLITAGLIAKQDSGHGYDRFRDRIMFPIRDRRGRTIAFGGRALGEATPKYLNSPETPLFHKGRELYGLYEARGSERRLHHLVVVEGYMDVVALAQNGIHNAVATLGTATTREHIERLFRVAADITFCFDGDRAGRQAAWRALENALPLIKDGRQAAFLLLPEGEDPDTLVRREGKQAFEQRLSQAAKLSDYFFRHLASEIDTASSEGRARLVEQAKPLLNRLPDSVFRDMMIARLADTTGIDSKSIGRRLNPVPAVPPPPHPNDSHRFMRTPVRRAIALLLYCSELARDAGDMSRFHNLSVPGLPLLVELVELLQGNPHLTLGTVLENYRDTETGRLLERMATWQPEIPDHLLKGEFLGALSQLEQRYSVEKQLLDKLAKGELNPEERELLRQIGAGVRTKP